MIKIVCPSKGRHNQVITKRLLKEIILVVPEKEVQIYKEHNPDTEIIGCSEKGITPTRQWILKKFEEVFFVDDDLKTVRKKYIEKPTWANNEDIIDFLNEDFYIAKQIGAKMIGFNQSPNPVVFSGLRLFTNTGYWNHSYVGYLKGHGLEFDTSYTEAEDYYMSCMNVYLNRYGLIDERYLFETKNPFDHTGGCTDYRTSQDMIRNTKKLIDKFGSDIVKFKKPNKTKQNVIFGERSLHFPI